MSRHGGWWLRVCARAAVPANQSRHSLELKCRFPFLGIWHGLFPWKEMSIWPKVWTLQWKHWDCGFHLVCTSPPPSAPSVEMQSRPGVLNGEVAGELIGTRTPKRRVRSCGRGHWTPKSSIFFGLSITIFSCLKTAQHKTPTTITVLYRAWTMAASKPLAVPAPCASAGCSSTESAGSLSKTQLLRQGREEASPTWKFHSVCFFCSIDWKDYGDRAPRHKGQSEVLEGLLQQVRALHQHDSCRGKDKNLLRAIDWGLGGAGNFSSFLTGSYLLIHQGGREILIFVHLESLYSTILL